MTDLNFNLFVPPTLVLFTDALMVQSARVDDPTAAVEIELTPVLIGYADDLASGADEDVIEHAERRWVVGPRAKDAMPYIAFGEQMLKDPIALPVILKTLEHQYAPIAGWITALPSRWGVNEQRARTIGELIRGSEWIDASGQVLSIPEAIAFAQVINDEFEISDEFERPWMVVYIGHEDVDVAVVQEGALVGGKGWSYGYGLAHPVHQIREEVRHSTGQRYSLTELFDLGRSELPPEGNSNGLGVIRADVAQHKHMLTWLSARLAEITNLYEQWSTEIPDLGIIIASETSLMANAPDLQELLPDLPLVQLGPNAIVEGLRKFAIYNAIVAQEEEE